MKKYAIKMVALLLLTSVAISSCSVEYRQRRMHSHDMDHHDDHHDERHY